MPEWIELVPHTQGGESGTLVRTKPGVCADGKTRGLFASDGGVGTVADAVNALVSQAAVGKFVLLSDLPPYRFNQFGRVERMQVNLQGDG